MNSKQKKEKLVRKLTNYDYRHAWVAESIKTALPFQIQANREVRDWSQEVLGHKADMKRNAISRLESVDYGNLTLNTLLRLSKAFDCGLLVKFVPFSRLVREFEDVSTHALEVDGFDAELIRLRSWSAASTQRRRPNTFQVVQAELFESSPIESAGKTESIDINESLTIDFSDSIVPPVQHYQDFAATSGFVM